MKAKTMLRTVRFCLPVVMVAVWGGTVPSAQEKPKTFLLLKQNVGIGQKKLIADTLEPAVKFDGGKVGLSDVEPAEAALWPKQTITLVQMDGKRSRGRLVSLDWDQSLLTLGVGLGGLSHKIYRISEVAKIEYRKSGRLKPGWVVVGFLGGALLGGFISREANPPSNDIAGIGRSTQQLGYIMIGGCLGAGLGAVISVASSSKTYTIEFNK